jgi:hypothetical protein
MIGVRRTAALWALVGALAGPASGGELASAHYRIVGPTLNGGGGMAASIGQPEALGMSGSSSTLTTVAPGLWPIVVGGLPTLDSDADVIPAWRDNCPFAFNPTQSDTAGILDPTPDGVGDACQCGDVDDDGDVDDFDVFAFRDDLAGLAPLSAEGTAKCTVIGASGPCTVLDVSVTERALEPAPLLPGIDQVCAAATAP